MDLDLAELRRQVAMDIIGIVAKARGKRSIIPKIVERFGIQGRRCSACGQFKAPNTKKFAADKRTTDGLRRDCRLCHAAESRAAYRPRRKAA
jgi:hypothetical protein